MSRNHVWMLLHQQFFKIHLCNKRKENHLKQFFVGVCVCVPLCVFLYMCLYISVCVPLCVCVSLCVSQCVSAINLCLFKHNAFDIRILLVPVLVFKWSWLATSRALAWHSSAPACHHILSDSFLFLLFVIRMWLLNCGAIIEPHCLIILAIIEIIVTGGYTV